MPHRERPRTIGAIPDDNSFEADDMADQQSAILYRMALPDHVCPFGVRAKELLEDAGYAVDDRVLASRGEVDAFMAERGVATTPQIQIDGEWIDGSEALEQRLQAA